MARHAKSTRSKAEIYLVDKAHRTSISRRRACARTSCMKSIGVVRHVKLMSICRRAPLVSCHQSIGGARLRNRGARAAMLMKRHQPDQSFGVHACCRAKWTASRWPIAHRHRKSCCARRAWPACRPSAGSKKQKSYHRRGMCVPAQSSSVVNVWRGDRVSASVARGRAAACLCVKWRRIAGVTAS